MAQAGEERAKNRGASLRRLLAEFAPFGSKLILLFVFVVIGALAQAGGPWLVGRAIDEHIVRGDANGLTWRMLELLGVYVVGTVMSRQQTVLVGDISQRVLSNLRERLFMQLQRLPLSYFDKRPIGDLMSRLLNDVDTLNQLFSQGITQLLGSFFGLIGILIAMLTLNVPLALASFTVIPVMLLTTALFAARARAAFRKTRETVGDVTADIQEEIGGVREAQAFNRTDENISRFRQRNAANRDANVSAVGITSAFSPSIEFLSTLATALVIGFGGYLTLQGNLTVGVLTAFLLYVQQFFRPIQLLSAIYTQAQSALAGAERIYGILDETPEVQDSPSSRTLGEIKGRIQFNDVSFAYDTGRNVLEGINLTVEPGQTVALVGSTGAGKTTVASLIPRFYDVTAGSVTVDGVDVREVTRHSLRSQIAFVLQEPFLFSGTIADNIRYGKLDATQAELEAAAKTVGALEFIQALPKGFDTVLGEGGGTLSQGQRQLLSFARAVIANPRILILDEATANVDTRTEALIQRALETLLKGRSSVVIAHRLSTVERADQIIVLEGGRIVERGSHAELIALNGRYADLHRRQFRTPAPAPTPATRAATVLN
jgi:ATP-binding cassette subfamily B protein/subfamily B ATP-binding cassette protein MsbA